MKKTRLIGIAVTIILAIITYIIGYSVSESSRISYVNSLATPSSLFASAKEAVISKCKKDEPNRIAECEEMRLFGMNNFYVEGEGQEQYIFVFSSSSQKDKSTMVYSAVANQEDDRIVEISRDSIDLLEDGERV
ncbi:MAG TPA: hypothetical protein PL051_00155 [Candidatus Saccharibacteria bacterium]|nr:hypothetical protein [Candidatus Saccharibacteria bacterium]